MRKSCITISFLLFLNLLVSCGGEIEGQGSYNKGTDKLRTSPNDDRAYRYLVLENGLKLVLISDKAADRSAASMSVFRGSYDDPADRQGLAHFLEHMLFIGTEKYPEPDGYLKFVRANGGSSNAYTASDHTNYFFDINPGAFREGLDRFAQFFISPLLSKEYVEREKNAVNAEYKMQYQDDRWRADAVNKIAINPEHPEAKFNIGNLETLSGEVHADLLAFFRGKYSANQMGLVVLTNEPLGEMENWVRNIFSNLKSGDLEEAAIIVPLVKKSGIPATLRHDNVKETYRISFGFPVASARKHFDSRPLDYISNLVGHEGEGSLHNVLIKKGWIESLVAGAIDYDETNSFVVVSMDMTEEGYAVIPKISRYLFDYLDLARSEPVHEWRYQEQAKMADIGFRFAEKVPAISAVQMISSRLNRYPWESILSSAYLMEKFDEDLIRDYLAKLKPDNVLVSISSPGYLGRKTEKYFGVSYDLDLGPLELPEIDSSELRLPEKNLFLPSSLELVEASPSAPRLALEDEGVEIYLDSDTDFGVPRAVTQVRVSPVSGWRSPRDQAFASLYAAIVEDSLNSLSYPAYLAGLSYEIEPGSEGFKITVRGYNEKQLVLLEEVLEELTGLAVKQSRFIALKNELLKDLKNKSFDKPYQQALRKLREELIESIWPIEKIIDELENATVGKLVRWRSSQLENVSVQALLVGNFDEGVPQEIRDLFGSFFTLTETDISPPEVLQVKNARDIDLHLEHDDAAILLYVQAGSESLEDRSKTALLHHLIAPGFFSDLRTDQQLGYVVAALNSTIRKRSGLGFIVQSPVAGPDVLRSRVLDYVKGQKSRLRAMGAEEFNTNKKGLTKKLLLRDKNLRQRASRYWSDFELDIVSFDGREQLALEVSKLTQGELISFLEKMTRNLEKQYMVISSGGRFARF
ncbi:MAG: hypothetical protein CMQ40_05655 [Gammaproteobacteria bacterium]|nr:hypothetical protein [Gammaproteobacteria bacterium]